ncbi:MAG: CAP domain-containing protein [Pacificimonas sp.]
MSIAALLSIVVGTGLSLPADKMITAATTPEQQCQLSAEERKSFEDLLNELRQRHGLSPVSSAEVLRLTARGHSMDMAARAKLSHFGSNGSDFVVRLSHQGYAPSYAAENVAWNQDDVAGVISDWEASPAHRRAMMSADITQFGLSRICSDVREPYWTLIVATPLAG